MYIWHYVGEGEVPKKLDFFLKLEEYVDGFFFHGLHARVMAKNSRSLINTYVNKCNTVGDSHYHKQFTQR